MTCVEILFVAWILGVGCFLAFYGSETLGIWGGVLGFWCGIVLGVGILWLIPTVFGRAPRPYPCDRCKDDAGWLYKIDSAGRTILSCPCGRRFHKTGDWVFVELSNEDTAAAPSAASESDEQRG